MLSSRADLHHLWKQKLKNCTAWVPIHNHLCFDCIGGYVSLVTSL